jgi:hypothetical protein
MLVHQYRRHAVGCLQIAEGLPDSQNRMALIDMAQSWLLLAQRAEENLTADLVSQTPPPPSVANGTAPGATAAAAKSA